jgi:hypothetical protein
VKRHTAVTSKCLEALDTAAPHCLLATITPNVSSSWIECPSGSRGRQWEIDLLGCRRQVLQKSRSCRGRDTLRGSGKQSRARIAELEADGVMGDPKEGADGALYEAMGFVRSSENRRGLVRRVGRRKG